MESGQSSGFPNLGLRPVAERSYDKIFPLEIESWCYGISRFPGALTPKIIHAVIREMSGTFLKAVQHQIAFNLLDVVARIQEASESIVNDRELTFYIIAQLPNPQKLNDSERATLDAIIARVQETYPDVVQRFEARLKKG